jgi:hypothetical protein
MRFSIDTFENSEPLRSRRPCISDGWLTHFRGRRWVFQQTPKAEIGCGRGTVEHKEEAISPTSAHLDSTGKDACEGF